MGTKLAALLVLALSASVLPMEAHHSFAAEYDASKAVRITGVISKVEWTNPHSYLYIDVKDDQGKLLTWTCEGGAPNALSRRGFRKNDIKIGDTVTIERPLYTAVKIGIVVYAQIFNTWAGIQECRRRRPVAHSDFENPL